MNRDFNDEHQTFIIVVSWFFTLLGAYAALRILGRLVIMVWTLRFDALATFYAFTQVIELCFAVAAFVVGVGMLSWRATALRNSVVVLWLYILWNAGAITWGVIDFSMRATDIASFGSKDSEIVQEMYRSGLAYTTYGTIFSILTCAVYFWLIRRLSLPIIKSAYVT